jgi:hypothetical protein
MKKIIKLTESDLHRIVKRVIKEHEMNELFGYFAFGKKGDKKDEDKESEAIEEIRDFDFTKLFVKSDEDKDTVKEKLNRRLENIGDDFLPASAELYPRLFEPQNVIPAKLNKGGKTVSGYIPSRFDFLVDKKKDNEMFSNRECQDVMIDIITI